MVAFLLLAAMAAQASGNDSDSLLSRGRIELAQGRLDSAAALFDQALDLTPRYAPSAVGLGIIALKRGDLDDAERLFELAEEWEPEKGHRQFGKGLKAWAEGNSAKARGMFGVAYDKNPNYADAKMYIARLERGQGKRGRAIEAYEQAIGADSNHPVAHLELGKLYERARRFAEAAEHYEAHIRIVQPDADVLTRLGYCLLEEGRYLLARQHLQHALDRITPKDPELRGLIGVDGPRFTDLHLGIAATYVQNREYELGQNAYARAYQHMPEDERVYYDDITHVASADEIAELDSLPGEARTDYVRTFWLRLDITPATEVNERLMEHYRRVWYARGHFSRGRDPWNDRGGRLHPLRSTNAPLRKAQFGLRDEP